MSVDKLKKKYETLRKKHELPEWSEIIRLGFMEESDLESILSLAKAVKKSIMNLQAVFQELLVPGDFVSMQDSKFLKGMRDELVDALAKIAHANRKFTADLMDATELENIDEGIAKAVSSAVRNVKEPLELYRKVMRKLEDGWKDANVEEEPAHYRW